ncbi:cytochrome P450 [Thermosporothrix hazakensis]|jgi:cytochrome P450|uniref:Cytochrome P450 n=2 Tax=Thermosporothrix hazakensis TaxID=644383 RepID=A0A326UJQ9_THEHA|nr:cytochrome P450 [Thermosporothrix hazakensis]PZW32713.1 cytochrome P450 [Thermosporothrix hazakensis]
MEEMGTRVLPGQLKDPYGWLQYMREQHPLYYEPATQTWHAFCYHDVAFILTKHEVFSTFPRKKDNEDMEAFLQAVLVALEPPRHGWYRYPVSRHFTVQALAPLAEKFRTITQELLDQIRPRGETNFPLDFSYPLHERAVMALFNLSQAQYCKLKTWLEHPLILDVTRPPEERFVVMEEVARFFQDEVFPNQPSEGLIHELLTVGENGRHHNLNDIETAIFLVTLILGAIETTPSMLSHAVYLCDEYPNIKAEILHTPELMKSFLDEVLRFRSPLWGVRRQAKTDIVIRDQHIPANSNIFAWIASANHDAEVFSHPDRFDIHRQHNPHLSFGRGIHWCLGAHMARLEASIALPMVFEQLPELRRDRTVPPEYLASDQFCSLLKLPFHFSPVSQPLYEEINNN